LAPDEINAMTAASLGFTAWRVPGLWCVFHPQADYRPHAAALIYRPARKNGDGTWVPAFEDPKMTRGIPCQLCIQGRKYD
jgi:hypothetical protein